MSGVALITGSAQGIGRSIALRLARDGFDIALNDVPSKGDQLRAVADEIEKIGRRTALVPADVSVDGEVKGMVQDVVKELGGLDVVSAAARCDRVKPIPKDVFPQLVANAGVFGLSPLISSRAQHFT